MPDRTVGGEPRPTVLIVGGFLTSPPLYWRMRDRLLRRGAGSVSIAPLWLPDWLLLPSTGYSALLRRTGRAVVRAYREGGGRPIVLIGHSAGGVLGRLALSPVAYRGRRAAIGDGVGALVTLGTPHHVTQPSRRQRVANDASAFLERTTPGAFLAPRVGYLTVASTAIGGGRRTDRNPRRALAGSTYAALLGEGHRLASGDGVIPVASAHLEGARQITLEGVVHGQGGRGPWYGDDAGLDGWWGAALEVWRTALAARAAEERPLELRERPARPRAAR
ncbi:MAG: esterase/lipase family protein [Candidatus Limnocylindrales bacterium]